jgi:hypothetical protein
MHEANEPDAVVDFLDAELLAGEPLACGMPIALVARNAIDVLGDDDIEAERFGCSHQVVEARTIDGRGAGDLAIAEGQHDRKAFAGAELAAGRDLIVDGSIVLTRSGRKWLRGSFSVASSSARRVSSAA